MTKTLSLLGSTGSIGRQSLEVAEHLGIRIAALTADRSVELVESQARRFSPRLVALNDEKAAADIKVRLADTGIRVLSGPDGLVEAATVEGADTVLTAVMGMVGLRPTLAAIAAGRRIALANKETLVCAGKLVTKAVRGTKSRIIPVDSEHSAIFQCLECGHDSREVKRLILTASGGPFFGMDRAGMSEVTKDQALRHPNWNMGPKITIDSATLMNKGLELIEAMWLYGMPAERISVLVHRESVIHSMVEFCDNSVLAQLGVPDMKLPIQYALTYPDRQPSISPPLDLAEYGNLTFCPPDMETFECLALGYRAANMGGTACAALNGANEQAVGLFLREKIRFSEIPELIGAALEEVRCIESPGLEDILEADKTARQAVLRGAGF